MLMVRRLPTFLCLLGICLGAWLGIGQGRASATDDRPMARVTYVEARTYEMQQQVELPGTVEAPNSSLVASEVEGRVEAILAREGQTVRKGAVLVELGSDHLQIELRSAVADHREAEARLQMAERNLERSKDLFEKEVLSQQQLDDARYETDAWQGRVDRLAAAKERIELDIERSRVVAPFSGIVVAEQTEVGQWVGKGDTVLELLSPYVLEVRVEVPERYFASMKRGSPATVRFEAIPGLIAEGKVSSVVPRASAQARTFPLKIKIDNPDGRIGAGMLADVSLSRGEVAETTLVPKDALITRGANRFVYLLETDQSVKMVPVETGAGIGQWIAVTGPVAAGVKVIARGNERLRPGQMVAAELEELPAP